VFQLVSDWFDSDLAEAAGEEIERLPGEVKLWMERYALSPIEVPFRPNKDELWLHLALVESARDRRAVFFRRILPVRPPPRVDESTLNKTPSTAAQWKRRMSFLGARARHHCQALLPALAGGLGNLMTKAGALPEVSNRLATAHSGVSPFSVTLQPGTWESVRRTLSASSPLEPGHVSAVSAATITRRSASNTMLVPSSEAQLHGPARPECGRLAPPRPPARASSSTWFRFPRRRGDHRANCQFASLPARRVCAWRRGRMVGGWLPGL
jgi:hypothetical protein